MYRDARCSDPSCTNSPACAPTASENLFGCDEHGVLAINKIGRTKPALPWPLPKSGCKPCTINPKFTGAFQRLVYIAVRRASTRDHIPAYFEPFFGAAGGKNPGWVCSSPRAKTDIEEYGFLALGGSTALGDLPIAQPQCGTPHH